MYVFNYLCTNTVVSQGINIIIRVLACAWKPRPLSSLHSKTHCLCISSLPFASSETPGNPREPPGNPTGNPGNPFRKPPPRTYPNCPRNLPKHHLPPIPHPCIGRSGRWLGRSVGGSAGRSVGVY